jgi:hypothetical protein
MRAVGISLSVLLSVEIAFGQCIDARTQDAIINSLRWNSFWLGTPPGQSVNETGKMLVSPRRTGIILSRSALWIMFVPSATSHNRLVIVRDGSNNLAREEAEYESYLWSGTLK